MAKKKIPAWANKPAQERWERQSMFHPAHHQWPPFARDVSVNRGTILEIPETYKGDKVENYKTKALHFQFNPASFGVNYTINERQLGADAQSAQAAAVVPLYPQPITFGIQLLFDRTFEVAAMRATPASTKWDDHGGVLIDVHTLEQMMGIPVMTTSGKRLTAQQLNQVKENSNTTSIQGLSYRPLLFLFNYYTGAGAMKFRGYITSATVNYLKFALGMIPTMASIDLSITQQVIPNDPAKAGNKGGKGKNNKDSKGRTPKEARDEAEDRYKHPPGSKPWKPSEPRKTPKPGTPDGGTNQDTDVPKDPEDIYKRPWEEWGG